MTAPDRDHFSGLIDLAAFRGAETLYPADFSDCVRRPYGLLFHNPNNPSSHDSNHAVITDDLGDAGGVVDEICAFYEAREVVPRIYSSFRGESERELLDLLAEKGFHIEHHEGSFFVWDGRIRSYDRKDLDIRRIDRLDDQLYNFIVASDGGEWNAKALVRHLRTGTLHLMVGYAESHPVSLASLHVMEGFTRLSDVMTHKDYQGRGYARAVVGNSIEYHSGLSSNVLYLSAYNPTAIRIYREAGFSAWSEPGSGWSAWLQPR